MARAPLHLLLLAALLAGAAAQRANFTLTLSALRPADPLSRTSPRIIGTNLGHKYATDPSWIAFFKRLGVNGARVFGVAGTRSGYLRNTVGQYNWMEDLTGAPVTSLAQWNAAVAQLRTPAGRNPANTSWANPPQWATVETVLATTDESNPADALDSNPNATVASLAAIGIVPLVVTQISCKTFDFVVDSPTQDAAQYFGERWELYKHSYVVARWTYARGIRKMEFWNEPDLTAGSSALGSTCMSPNRWLEQYTVRSQAIQDAYADFNADVSAGRMACPALIDSSDAAPGAPPVSCPFSPVITTAFAARTFDGDATSYFGKPTVANLHLRFPPYANVTVPSWSNMQAYSYHSYGKEGYDLAKSTKELIQLVNSNHDLSPMPIYTTEHASKTASSWNLAESSSDDYFEASRLASQLLWMSLFGLESYVFKMSSTPSNNGGIIKSGMHWGENDVAPFPISDTTRSGEAARMIIPTMLGRDRQGMKPLYTCTTGTGSAYRPCALVEDNGVFTMLLVNDGVITATSGSKMPQALTVSVNLAALVPVLLLQNNTVAVVSELSGNGFYNEVSSMPVLTSNSGWTFTLPTIPSWSVLSITLPTGAQTVTALPAAADASVAAGANAGTNYGSAATLSVGTSITAVHDTTSVAFVRFDASAYRTARVSSAILELTVASAATAPSLLQVFALSAATAAAWTEAGLTWTSAGFALNASLSTAITSVVNNFVRLDNGHLPAGHITVNPTDVGVTKRLDVTESVAAASANGGAGVVGFLIARRMRNNLYAGNVAPAAGIPADTLNGGLAVAFVSKEGAAASAPKLRVIVNGAASSAPRSALAPQLRTHADDQDYDSVSDTDLTDADGQYASYAIAELHVSTGEDGQCNSWESPYLDHYAVVTGTVTAVFDAEDATVIGFVMQDDTVPFSGILVLLTPEQLGSLAAGQGFMPAQGASVSVEAVVGHVLGNVVLQQVSAVALLAPRVPLPRPVPTTTGDLAAGCTLRGEQYRNMVVSLSNAAFTIDPTSLSPDEYAAATADLAGYTAGATSTDDDSTDPLNGELWLDDGSGPVQVDNQLFDIVSELGWAQPGGGCGASLGDVLDSLVVVPVFDDNANRVAYELGDPPSMELNIISLSSSGITPCAQGAPPAPSATVAALSGSAQLTLEGISTASFDLDDVAAAVASVLGAGVNVSVEVNEFPVTGAVLGFSARFPPSVAAADATATALLRALAAFQAPLLPHNLLLRALPAAAGRRLLQTATPVSFGVDVHGSQSTAAAAAVVAALPQLVNATSSRGLASKLAIGGATAVANVALSTPPVVSASLTVTAVYAKGTSKPQTQLDNALSAGALAQALSARGVANTGVTVADTDGDDEELTDRERKIIGGVIGGFFGLVFALTAVYCCVKKSKKAEPRTSTKIDTTEPAEETGSRAGALSEADTPPRSEALAVEAQAQPASA